MQPQNLQHEIGRLADLDLTALRRYWLELYGTQASTRTSREILVQAIAYRLQEKVFGGLSTASRARLIDPQTPFKAGKIRIDRTAKSGTRFIREWQGRTIEVVANQNGGFVYRGENYRSLSAVAREITGTRWSGPAFFGLKQENKRGEH